MSDDLLIHTARFNRSLDRCVYDEREPLEATIFENMEIDELRSALYRFSVKEYGRCTGKVYVDKRTPTNDKGGERWDTVHTGWCFVKRERYEDDTLSCCVDEAYLCETWVTVERVVEPARPTVVACVALS